MPRTCSICNHAQHAEIDALLIQGDAFREIAKQYGTSSTALHRHKTEHLPAAVIKAENQEAIRRSDELLATANKSTSDLLEQVRQLQQNAYGILEKALAADQKGLALQAIRESRENLRLSGELLGELDKRPQIGIVIASPEWQATRTKVLIALEPFPEARAAVARALGNGNGHVGE